MKTILLVTALALPAAAQAQDHSHHAPTPAPPPLPLEPAAEPMDHGQHQGMTHAMTGALGGYTMSREASGTSWQPDQSIHQGIHGMSGQWSYMVHALLNGVYDWQEAPRGSEKGFVAGMVMASARRDTGDGTLQFRTMLSPDPIMGRGGYPLLLASGETADGINPLVDRQHPHDFFMELSASYSHRLSDRDSLFLYGGLPGEPAFGPPAFMHRLSIMDSPEAPISHHWLDSTHIVFGVLTAGWIHGNAKLEVSRFRGREPDEHRWDIETGPLDSTAVRASWNPTPTLSLQASFADVKSPEQLEPDEDQTKWSASAIYTRQFGQDGLWSTTAAWGRRSAEHDQLDAFIVESAVRKGNWTVFARGERTENNELVSEGGHHGPVYDVAKVSLGAVRDFEVAPKVKLGLGGLYAFNFVPGELEPLYEGDPQGAMAFVRLKVE